MTEPHGAADAIPFAAELGPIDGLHQLLERNFAAVLLVLGARTKVCDDLRARLFRVEAFELWCPIGQVLLERRLFRAAELGEIHRTDQRRQIRRTVAALAVARSGQATDDAAVELKRAVVGKLRGQLAALGRETMRP